MGVQTISEIWKINSKIKLSNNLYSVILIFEILKFRNIGRSIFRRSKIWPPPPKNFKFEKLANFPICYNWRYRKMIKYSRMFNVKNYRIFKLQQFGIFFCILPFEKSIFYNFVKSLNISVVQIIRKKWKKDIR